MTEWQKYLAQAGLWRHETYADGVARWSRWFREAARAGTVL
jgi:hypothetical protein